MWIDNICLPLPLPKSSQGPSSPSSFQLHVLFFFGLSHVNEAHTQRVVGPSSGHRQLTSTHIHKEYSCSFLSSNWVSVNPWMSVTLKGDLGILSSYFTLYWWFIKYILIMVSLHSFPPRSPHHTPKHPNPCFLSLFLENKRINKKKQTRIK